MSLQLGMAVRHEQRHSQVLCQRAMLKQLNSLRCELVCPAPPYVIQGLEGLQVADAVLKERNATGILIGGLAETVWRKSVLQEELSEHKDVDVLVLNSEFSLREYFEEGIDWWLPRTSKIRVRSDLGQASIDATWWENGSGVALSFRAIINETLKSGLYIPMPSWLIEMRWEEALANLDPRVEIEADLKQVKCAFQERLDRTMGPSLPPFLEESFRNQILPQNFDSEVCSSDPVIIIGQDFEDRAAINSKAISRNQQIGNAKSLKLHFDQLTLLLSHKDCDFGECAKLVLPALVRNRTFRELAEDASLALSEVGFGPKRLCDLHSQLLLLDQIKDPKQPERLKKHCEIKRQQNGVIWNEVRTALGIVEDVLFRYRQRWEVIEALGLGLHDRESETPNWPEDHYLG